VISLGKCLFWRSGLCLTVVAGMINSAELARQLSCLNGEILSINLADETEGMSLNT
jgi:hypothetical protein